MGIETKNHQDQVTTIKKEPRPYREYRDFIKNSDGLSHKDSQERIAAAIRDGIASGRPVIAEGGTGNGKTVSYLVPAIEALHRNPDKKLVISTYSIALQNQLVRGQKGEKAEIPRVLAAMRKKYGNAFKIGMNDVSVIMGAGQHVCEESEAFPHNNGSNPVKDLLVESIGLEKYEGLYTAVKKARHEKKPLLLRELEMYGIKDIPGFVKEEISCRGAEGCKHFGDSDKTCSYAEKMKLAMDDARIIVTNHHMLTMNRGLQMKLIRDNIIVIDEANKLPDLLTRMANSETRLTMVKRTCEQFLKLTNQMPLLSEITQRAGLARQYAEKLYAAIDITEKAFMKMCEEEKSTAIALRDVDGKIKSELDFYRYLNELNPGSKARDTLEDARKAFENLVSAVKLEIIGKPGQAAGGKSSDRGWFAEVIRDSERFIRGISDFHRFGSRALKDSWLKDSEKNARKYNKNRNGVQYESYKGDSILWFEKQGRNISMFSAPLDHVSVQRSAAEGLFNRTGTVPVFISATLSTNARKPDFKRFKSSMGMMGWTTLNKPPIEIHEASDHDYGRQALLLIPTNLPQPKFHKDSTESHSLETEQYYNTIASNIIENVKLVNGNSMVLCSSGWQAAVFADKLKKALPGDGYMVLNQTETPSVERLIHTMGQGVEPKKVLIGTDALWNGIDLRGESLRGLFIIKAPFPVPDHPVEKERKARWGELHKGKGYFADIALPVMLDKMRQGSGRLIRSGDIDNEYGVTVFYDPRFSESPETQKRKRYPAMILESFPEGTPVVQTEHENITAAVKDFFEKRIKAAEEAREKKEEKAAQSAVVGAPTMDEEEIPAVRTGMGM